MLDELLELLLRELLEKLDDKLLALERDVLLLDEAPRLDEEGVLEDLVLDELLDLVEELEDDLLLDFELEFELLDDEDFDRLELDEFDADVLELDDFELLRLLDIEVLVCEPLLLDEE